MNIIKKQIECTSLDVARTGDKINEILIKNDCTVKELQRMLNLSCPQSVYRWVRGKAMPSVDNLYMISKIFGVSMEELLVERGEKQD